MLDMLTIYVTGHYLYWRFLYRGTFSLFGFLIQGFKA